MIYKENAISIKIPMVFSTEIKKKISTICMEPQKTENSQSNNEKKEQSCIIHHDFKLDNPGLEPMSLMSPVLAERFFTTSTIWEAQTHRSMEQKRETQILIYMAN